MLKKNFVSLVFSAKKLQILQLNPSKKKVERYLTADIPEGLIVGHKVQDVDILAKLISQVWKKANIKEKTVGLVVPEFSTFIKTLDMPNLSVEELDEAISWQAHDYLPKSPDSMTMDWRIAKKEKDNVQVLLVAMEKELLNGYVNAVGKAGLFPELVETPSLSLVRASDVSVSNKLIIYAYFEEVIVTIADKEKIIVSSVVDTKDPNEIISTINRILGHYKDIKIENVLIGGFGIDQVLIDALSKGLKKEIKILNIKVGGISNEDTQNYLIPLSLQFKPPSEPADENTVNLLPKSIIDEYKKKHDALRYWSLLMLLTFVVWSSFLATLGVYIYFLQQIRAYEQKTSANRNVIIQTQDARQTIGEINKASSSVLKIMDLSLDPQDILNNINSIKNDGISIRRYKMELDRYEIEIEGVSLQRSDLIDFKSDLEDLELVEKATIPISSFEVESDLNFNMILTLNKKFKKQ
ncbi:pilus assembly protein PilM [Candidatus Woesebacteria bacterium]|nr:pilus assembly protein PilM [Candidatus Woesebacteria bacterium]